MKYLQMRLQMLRGAMAREHHPNYTLVTRARTSRVWNAAEGEDSGCVLIIQPNDAQFTKIFKDAGVEATTHDRDILEDIGEPPPPIIMEVPENLTPSVDPYAKFKGD
jgi:hypothetical protein